MIVKMIKNLENKMKKMQESINKDLEELKSTCTETNNTTTEIKNTLEEINSRVSETEEKNQWARRWNGGNNFWNQKKVKRMKRAEDSLRGIWDHIKCTNIWIIGVPEEEGEKKDMRKILKIIVENFPNVEKEIVNQVQEAERVPYRINPRRNMPRHILIKLTNTKQKEY